MCKQICKTGKIWSVMLLLTILFSVFVFAENIEINNDNFVDEASEIVELIAKQELYDSEPVLIKTRENNSGERDLTKSKQNLNYLNVYDYNRREFLTADNYDVYSESSNIKQENILVKNIDFYDLSTEEIDLVAKELAKDEKRPVLEVKREIVVAKNEGKLSAKIAQYQSNNPIKYRTAMFYLKSENPELYTKVSNIKKITPTVLEKTVQRTSISVPFSSVISPSKTIPARVSLPQIFLRDDKTQVLLPRESVGDKNSRIKIRDSKGEEVANIIFLHGNKVQDLQEGGEIRDLESIRMVSVEKETLIKTGSHDFVKVKAFIDVALISVNSNSAIDLEVRSTLNKNTKNRFTSLAKKQKLALKDLVGVMEVKKTGLVNGNEVGESKIVFKVQKTWVDTKNTENFRVFRQSGSIEQILPTKFAGYDDKGYAIFTGTSKGGLSTFALFMVESVKPEDTGFTINKLKTMGLPFVVFLVVGGLFLGTYFGRVKQKKKNN